MPLRLHYPISIAILYYSGETRDLEDSWETAVTLNKVFRQLGHIVQMCEVSKKNWRKALRVPGKIVFNLVEDEEWVLYHKVGLALSQMGRAQVGHALSDLKYVTEKSLVKARLAKLNIATPLFRVFNRRSKLSQIRGLRYPLIVKPSGQHASIGISQDSVVIDQEEMTERVNYLFKKYPGEVIVEEFIEGREFHVTVMGNGKRIVVLPYVECEFKGEFKDNWELYTYEAKWLANSWEYWNAPVHPARVDQKTMITIDRLVKRAYRACECKDIARFDIRMDEAGKPYIIDLNMNPGIDFHDNEETWISARQLGWTYGEFVETLIAITYKRVYGKLPDRSLERQFMLSAGRNYASTG